ncbi:MAG TPA: hypothetical protein VNI55_01915 [Gaiellaceae bacterium]|nr:hypothetical protein [Gaiellaceae bacterium]
MAADGRARGNANLHPATPGNQLALKHGAANEARIRPAARNHRRRVLRQIGLRASDLDPIGRGYLDTFCRVQAKLEAIDAYIDREGLIRPNGEPQPVMRLYVSLANSARLSLSRLELHVRAHVSDPHEVVRDWFATLPESDEGDDADP